MKKTIFLLIGLAFCTLSYAQITCTPQYEDSVFGVWPQEFPPAQVGVPYSQMLDFKAPTSTSDIPDAPSGGTIESFKILSVTGLPTGFTHTCNKTNCEGYVGGNAGCAELTGTAQPGQEGNYTITVTIEAMVKLGFFPAAPITQSFSNFVFQVVNPNGPCVILDTLTEICKDSIHQLTASAPDGVWTTTDSTVVSITASGEIKGVKLGNAMITYGGGTSTCTGTANKLISVVACSNDPEPPTGTPDPPTGNPNPPTNSIDDWSSQTVYVYPNPAKDVLVVEHSNELSACEIYSLNGQMLVHKKITASQEQVDINTLQAGIYFIRLYSDKGIQTQKFIKE